MYSKSTQQIIDNLKKVSKKIALIRTIQNNSVNIFSFFATVLYLSYMVIYNNMSLGIFIILVNATVQLSHKLMEVFFNVTDITENSLYIENLCKFLNYKPFFHESDTGLSKDNFHRDITFFNVCYRYKNATCTAISGINCTISKGEKIALVGFNGAGKSTFIKNLLRLYEVTSGEITMDGITINKYSVDDYRKLYSTLFQDYKIFSLSIAENILMRKVEDENDISAVKKSLEIVGLDQKVGQFKNGIYTTITKEFDKEGEELSGGELQKIAIARAFVKNSPIVILDEPTSSLDPLAEYDIYKNIFKICKGRTIIFISHRLSTTKLADKIFFMKEGKIITSGNHEYLMQYSQDYYEMYTMQAASYLGDL